MSVTIFPGLITPGLQESRKAPAEAYPSDDAASPGQSVSDPFRRPFVFPPTRLLSAMPIPPEAPTEEDWARFLETADDEVCWDADSASPGPPRHENPFTLETRGITQQIAEDLPPVCSPDHTEPLPTPKIGLTPHHGAFVRPGEVAPEPVEKKRQSELWQRQTVHKNSIAAKLREAGMPEEAQKLENCHSRYVVAICNDCGTVKKFPNRCDQGHCPECQPGLARERVSQVEWWTSTLKQPKHVVLTFRNIPHLTRAHLNEARISLTALRRTAFATKTTYWWQDRATLKISRRKKLLRPTSEGWPLQSSPWVGGFWTMEITREGKGWHLHFHLLVDSKFISQRVLAERWRHITRGFSYITKVMDCRENSYLKEVTKYAVKGSQLAAWEPDAIVQYLRAFSGSRTFGVFGSLYGARTEFAEFIAQLKGKKSRCECGSCNVRYLDELLYLAEQCTPKRLAPCRPPPPPEAHPQFSLNDHCQNGFA